MLPRAAARTQVGQPLSGISLFNSTDVLDTDFEIWEYKGSARYCSLTFWYSGRNVSTDDLIRIDAWNKQADDINVAFVIVDLSANPVRAEEILATLDIETKLVLGRENSKFKTLTPSTYIVDLEQMTCAAADLRGEQIDQVISFAVHQTKRITQD